MAAEAGGERGCGEEPFPEGAAMTQAPRAALPVCFAMAASLVPSKEAFSQSLPT